MWLVQLLLASAERRHLQGGCTPYFSISLGLQTLSSPGKGVLASALLFLPASALPAAVQGSPFTAGVRMFYSLLESLQ